MKISAPLLVLVCLMIPSAPAQEKAATPAAGPDLYQVKPRRLTIVEKVTARVEATDVAELRTSMDVWTGLVVEQVVPQGTEVTEGAVVLQFETEKIMDQLKDNERELQIAAIGLRESQADLELATQTLKLDQQLAEITWERLQQDVKYYFDVQLPLAKLSAERRLQNAQYSVEYAQDELDQLKQMYQEDELTEESEKIVLKRAERALDQAKFGLEATSKDVEHTLAVELPRNEFNQRTSQQRGELEFAKSQFTLPAQMEKKRLGIEKQKLALDKQQRDLEKLRRDYENMTLRAPIPGIVYHGQPKRGAWVNSTGGNSRLIDVGSTVPKDVVAITIVDPSQLRLRCDLNEKQMGSVKAGVTGVATPTIAPETRLDVAVQSVDRIPIDESKFDCLLSLEGDPGNLLPGMTCEVRLRIADLEQAILVPKSAVFSDDEGLNNYVYLWVGEKSQRQPVSLGRTQGDDVEITQGLKANDQILKKKPE